MSRIKVTGDGGNKATHTNTVVPMGFESGEGHSMD